MLKFPSVRFCKIGPGRSAICTTDWCILVLAYCSPILFARCSCGLPNCAGSGRYLGCAEGHVAGGHGCHCRDAHRVSYQSLAQPQYPGRATRQPTNTQRRSSTGGGKAGRVARARTKLVQKISDYPPEKSSARKLSFPSPAGSDCGGSSPA